MPRVIWFGLRAENPDRAKEFYSQVFGWSVEEESG
jgi:predicted enzyme related to lactoylglutathione lyase